MDRRQSLLERLFWMVVFCLRYPECMKQLTQRGPQGCAQMAAEEADAAVDELRKRAAK